MNHTGMPSDGKPNKKVLFIVNHRKDRSPGQRFRFEQYLDFLETNGYEIDFSILLDAKDDKDFYKPGNYAGKARIFLKSLAIRTKNMLRANDYDIIFIFREALMTGSTFFERRFAKSRAKLIFDFDDAIWVDTVSEGNKKLAFLKNASKTGDIIGLSDLIFAGNEYLADYARKFNPNVVIVPTTIDTDVYRSQATADESRPVCIGWSGSFSTIEHFATAIPALRKIREKYGSRVTFKIIGDGTYYCKELDTKGVPWKGDTEIRDLSQIDIGIMPLPDTEWAKGKCGLKGLQYMALGIPSLMSPVGVNTDIIQNGVNGYLPATDEEWVGYLSELIESRELRQRVGDAGKKTVEDLYSVNVWKKKYLEYFDRLTA
jgi:glycosyltransferase involved in cell wall biosynthesis